jgi:hypothetical protein
MAVLEFFDGCPDVLTHSFDLLSSFEVGDEFLFFLCVDLVDPLFSI